MKVSSLEKQPTSSLVLILSKEEREIEQALALFPPFTHMWDRESYTIESFADEAEALSFITPTKRLLVRDLDQLKKEELKQLKAVLTSLAPTVSVILVGATAPADLIKDIERRGTVVQYSPIKPWERHQKIAQWVVQKVEKGGAAISSYVALEWVKAVGTTHAFLEQEVAKLLCYKNYQGEVTLADIQKISSSMVETTFWQLSDMIFSLNRSGALNIARKLEGEGVSFFALISSLRTQFETAINILALLGEGGTAAVQSAYPYLKGKILEKKLSALRHYTRNRLLYGIKALFISELKGKNSGGDVTLLLELLITRLTHADYAALSVA